MSPERWKNVKATKFHLHRCKGSHKTLRHQNSLSANSDDGGIVAAVLQILCAECKNGGHDLYVRNADIQAFVPAHRVPCVQQVPRI